MAFNRYQVDNFFITTIANGQTLNPGTDGVLNLLNVPNIEDGKIFFVIFNVNDPSKRKVIPVYMDDGFVKYRGYDIDSVIELYKYDEIAINDLAELFNTIFELTDDIGRVVRKGGLNVLVYGGDIVKGTEFISVPDTSLVLHDNMVNYIIFDYTDDKIKAVTTLSGAYYLFGTANCSGGEIGAVAWKRAFNVNDFFSALFFERDNNGEVIIKDESITGLQIDFTSFDADDIFQGQTHLFLTPEERDDIGANTTARHTHPNKSLLDTYNQTNANIKDAVQKRHDHPNKSTLDKIPDFEDGNEGDVLRKVGNTIIWAAGGGGGGDGSTAAHTDIFVGDGISNSFNLSFLPLNDDVIFMTNDSGQTYYNGIDYTRSGKLITFDSIPDDGRYIYVKYFEQIDISQVGETNTMINLPGSGIGVYKQKSGVQFQMRRVRGVNGITVTQIGDEVVIDGHISVGPGGEANTASNVGTGIGLFKLKSGVDLQFKTIGGSDSINVIELDDDTIGIEVNQGGLNKTYYRHFMY